MRPSAASPRTCPRRAPPRAERGAALLVVIVSIAILTAIAVDLAYSTRVSLLTAANARDELRAEYQARSAAQLSRLVLRFQNQLDSSPMGPAAGGVRIQVWRFVPITDDLARGLFRGEGSTEGGPPPGKFEAKLEDEGAKVNAQLDAIGRVTGAQVLAFLQLVGDARWDPLFDREDANGLRVTRTDVAVYLHDWTDLGSVSSAISPGNPEKPFEDAFGDENQPYSRGDDRYQTKNARFDSLDELYLVAGIDDAFMTAFGRQLTVYRSPDGYINVNSTDPQSLRRNAALMADERGLARLQDPNFPADLGREISLRTVGGTFALTVPQFAELLEFLGVPVNPIYRQANAAQFSPGGAFTDRSSVFRIRATGTAGAVERRVDAVITFDPTPTRQEGADLGRLLHWREE